MRTEAYTGFENGGRGAECFEDIRFGASLNQRLDNEVEELRAVETGGREAVDVNSEDVLEAKSGLFDLQDLHCESVMREVEGNVTEQFIGGAICGGISGPCACSDAGENAALNDVLTCASAGVG